MKKFTEEEIIEMCRQNRIKCSKATREEREESIRKGMEIINKGWEQRKK